MPVKIAKEIIATYPAPFKPGLLGIPGTLLPLEANVDGIKSDAPQLVNSVHTLDSLRFSSSHSSSLFVILSLSQPGPSYPLSKSFCFSCPASSPSGTFSPIQGSHPLFLPSSVPCSSSRLACSRLSVVGEERKRARKKRGKTKARSDGRACKTFFNDPLLV